MKITLHNLGSIKETVLDLRPLTVIIGPNNSNKTYISYSIYGLWKFMREHTRLIERPLALKEIDKTTFTTKYDSLSDLFKPWTIGSVKSFKSSLTNFFQDSSGKLFANTTFDIEYTAAEKERALDDLVKAKYLATYQSDVLSISRQGETLTVTVEHPESPSNDLTVSRFALGRILFSEVVRKLVPQPFLLPAERNAFIITYKMLGNRRYKFLRETQRSLFGSHLPKTRQLELLKEQGDIRYPEPIEDFLEFLEDLEFQKNLKIESKKKSEFQKLADLIEFQIQNKNKTNLLPTRLGGREIKVSVKRGLSIDLYNASSSIKQLAPLLLYLRYRARRNDLLIIDEPEMNLHPESQARLLEILGMLVNEGVNVLLTTHSPYFMSHLNNLVDPASEDSEGGEKQASRLYVGDKRAFLTSEQVGAYEMRDNKLRSLRDADYGFRWDTLSDVSSEIQQKFFEINQGAELSADGKTEQ
jgi:AAA15 family ATPase/GTPase